MLKKMILGAVVGATLLFGTAALACNCGEQYRTYDYMYTGNGQHYGGFSCSNKGCDDPYTDLGRQNCNNKYVYWEDQNTWEWYWAYVCTDCGHVERA